MSFGFAAIGGLWAGADAFGLLGPLESLTFVLLGVATIAATVVGVRRYRPGLRWPWVLMCSALVVFVVGGAARMDLHTLGNTSASRSLIPDAITLPGYLLLAIGLSGLARVRGRGRSDELDNLLDGVVAALAALTLAWVYLIDPVLFQKHSPLPVRFVLAAYPAMSVLFVAIAAPLALVPGKRRAAAYRFLLAATACLLAGDVLYMFIEVGVAPAARLARGPALRPGIRLLRRPHPAPLDAGPVRTGRTVGALPAPGPGRVPRRRPQPPGARHRDPGRLGDPRPHSALRHRAGPDRDRGLAAPAGAAGPRPVRGPAVATGDP